LEIEVIINIQIEQHSQKYNSVHLISFSRKKCCDSAIL